MNEQLRKAIEESTKIEFVDSHETVICHSDHHASQAKLLRVIELLVQRRNEWIEHIDLLMNTHRQHDRIKSQDAELIAALERKGEGT